MLVCEGGFALQYRVSSTENTTFEQKLEEGESVVCVTICGKIVSGKRNSQFKGSYVGACLAYYSRNSEKPTVAPGVRSGLE